MFILLYDKCIVSYKMKKKIYILNFQTEICVYRTFNLIIIT